MLTPTLTPVRLDWLQAAAILPGKSLHIGLLLYTLCSRRGLPLVRLTRRMLDGVSRDAFYDGLVRLEELRLVNVSHSFKPLIPDSIRRSLRLPLPLNISHQLGLNFSYERHEPWHGFQLLAIE